MAALPVQRLFHPNCFPPVSTPSLSTSRPAQRRPCCFSAIPPTSPAAAGSGRRRSCSLHIPLAPGPSARLAHRRRPAQSARGRGAPGSRRQQAGVESSVKSTGARALLMVERSRRVLEKSAGIAGRQVRRDPTPQRDLKIAPAGLGGPPSGLSGTQRVAPPGALSRHGG